MDDDDDEKSLQRFAESIMLSHIIHGPEAWLALCALCAVGIVVCIIGLIVHIIKYLIATGR